MDKLVSDPVDGAQKETHQPWWRGRVQICWLVFGGLLTVSSLVVFTREPVAWLNLLGCLSGSLLAAPLVVYLVERLFRVDPRA